jgi:hypothetical protein
MAVVASATGVALGMTAGTIGAGLVGGAVLGAGIGGLYSAVTGDGDILNSMLTGGLIGFGVGGLGAAAGAAGAAGGGGAAAGGAGAAGAGGAAASTLSLTPTATALAGNTAALIPAASSAGGFGLSAGAVPTLTSGLGATGAGVGAGVGAGSGLTMGQVMGYGLAGSAAMSLLGNSKTPKLSSTTGTDPSYIRPYNYSANPTNNYQVATGGYPTSYNGLGSSAEQRYFNPTQTAQPIYKAAEGGLTPNLDFMGNGAYPMSQQNSPRYAVPSQMPTSAQQVTASYEQNTNPLTGQPITMADGGSVPSMSSDEAVKAYNDAIMQKAIQTYVTPQQNTLGQNTTFPAQQSMAPQGYMAQQVPSNFDQTLLDQYRSANPNLRSYNAATQTYGAGIPNQSQYDAFKAQKEKEAADLLAQQYVFNPMGDSGGGGAAGGLPRDFAYANGGHLGGYSDGGRMLKGPGDGMSDNIPASIGGKQPARLADGEFVVPADVVSHLGNGSTDAGAKRLYSMMDNVRKARTGSKKQGKQIKAGKFLPA